MVKFIKAFVAAVILLVVFLWQINVFLKHHEESIQHVAVKQTPTGLQKAFPPMKIPKDNPVTPEKVELGRLLFFDSILSGDNKISCAHCHHPQKGFCDGGSNAKNTKRDSPTIFNAAYRKFLFWDGRAKSLEKQAAGPITAEGEMNEKPENLVKELKNIPGYVEKFQKAFPEDADAVTFENVTKAIASFERTLVSNNSAFDRYAGGDDAALTPAQLRGLALYRSTRTWCFECHALPTFEAPLFKVVGAPEKDALTGEILEKDFGREKVTKNPSLRRAFLVPTLRNVALTAPYMHNKSLKTLEQVVDFYSDGGGDAFGMKGTDPHITKINLSAQEKKDLAAFLRALTDDSSAPPVPERVPSGLSVVEPMGKEKREDIKTPKKNMI